jgi:cytidylate kinase
VEVKPDAQNRYGYKILVEGQDITDHLFEADVARYVSPVAKISQVRKILVAQQKHIAQGGGVVMAGRDITTVVMPDAEIKIYLTASEEERVKRRYRELIQKGENTEVSHVRENVQLRDTIDSSREDSPLCIADDAIVLDSSDKSIEQVVEEVLEIVNKYPGRSVTLNKS